MHLRLRRAYASGELVEDVLEERRGVPWREYYAARNLLLIARRHAGRGGVVRAAARSVAGGLRAPAGADRLRFAVARVVGVVHGLAGVRGRVIEPGEPVRLRHLARRAPRSGR